MSSTPSSFTYSSPPSSFSSSSISQLVFSPFIIYVELIFLHLFQLHQVLVCLYELYNSSIFKVLTSFDSSIVTIVKSN
ncbi:hypothetical protein QL285_092320 [Trifolium repens]|nr:hypothetical protein QL285_092320 [Trifolium repens]